MRNKFLYITVGIFLMNFRLITAPLSFDVLAKNYSLLLLVSDHSQQEYVGVFNCEQLLKGEIPHIAKESCIYQRSVWDSVSSLWEDILKPEDMGCYPILRSTRHQGKTLNFDDRFILYASKKRIQYNRICCVR